MTIFTEMRAAIMEEPSPPNPSVVAAGTLSLLLVDDEPNIRKVLSVSLRTDGHRVTAVTNAADAVTEAARQSFDLAFVDLRLGAETGLDLIPRLLAQSPWLRVVVMTAYASIDTAVEAIRRGASDYLPKPFTPVQVRMVIERVAKMRSLEQRVAGLQGGEIDPAMQFESRSPAMLRALSLGRQVADSEATVLIRGERRDGQGRAGQGDPLLERPEPEALCRRFVPHLVGPVA